MKNPSFVSTGIPFLNQVTFGVGVPEMRA